MKECKVIKDISLVMKWERAFKKRVKQGKFSERQFLFFLLGLGTGLQYEELIRIKYEDLKLKMLLTNAKGRPKEVMYIVLPSKSKRRKVREIMFPADCKKRIEQLRKEYSDDTYLFQNKSSNMVGKPPASWSVDTVRRFLTESAEAIGMSEESIGAALLRKTFGYLQLKHGGWTLRDLQQYFEMRSIKLVKEYVGITGKEFD